MEDTIDFSSLSPHIQSAPEGWWFTDFMTLMPFTYWNFIYTISFQFQKKKYNFKTVPIFYRWGNKYLEQLTNLLKVTCIATGRTEFLILALWL